MELSLTDEGCSTYGFVTLALLGALLLACGASVATHWEPHSSRTYGPLCSQLVRFYPGDSEDLVRANAVIVGEIYANGNAFSDFWDLSETAEAEASSRGGTHIVYTEQSIDTTNVPLSGSYTRCHSWGSTVDCSTLPLQTVKLHKPQARFVVVRVERAHWQNLPAQLRPKC